MNEPQEEYPKFIKLDRWVVGFPKIKIDEWVVGIPKIKIGEWEFPESKNRIPKIKIGEW